MANDEQQQPDTTEPSDKRKAELEAAYEAQKETDAPYKGVRIKTLGEVQWIMIQRQWSGEFILEPETKYANLSNAILDGVNLSNAKLFGANLSGSSFNLAILKGAQLTGAYLRQASLDKADLSDASLIGADLSNTYIDGINLSNTRLTEANLSSAAIFFANLSRGEFLGLFRTLCERKNAGSIPHSHRYFRRYFFLLLHLVRYKLL